MPIRIFINAFKQLNKILRENKYDVVLFLDPFVRKHVNNEHQFATFKKNVLKTLHLVLHNY